jgi:tetratricopeptide (TPR) repeat protein
MPKADISNAPHTTQSDHRIPRVPSSQAAGQRYRRTAPDVNDFDLFDSAVARIPDIENQRGWGILLSQQAEALNQRSLADAALERLAPLAEGAAVDDLPLHAAMIASLVQVGRLEEAQHLLDRWLPHAPDDPRMIELAVKLYEASGQLDRALEHAVRLSQLNADSSLAWGLLAYMQAASGQPEAAIESAGRGLQLKPASIPLRSLLLGLLEVKGDDEELARQREILRLLQSSRPPPTEAAQSE